MIDPAEYDHDAEEDLVLYRAVSPLAIIAALLGGLSILSVWWPVFVVVALLAIICGVLALRAIASSPQSLTGGAAALIGIALGVTFLIAPAAQLYTRDYQLRSQGEHYASQWLQLILEGQLPLAHQLTLVPNHREPRGVDLQQYYQGSPRSLRDMQELFDEEPIRSLIAHGATGQLSQGQVLQVHTEKEVDFVVLRFDFRYQEAGKQQELPLRIILEHSRRESDRGRWRIHSSGTIDQDDTSAG